MIDFTKGVFQSDEFLKVHLNGNWCNINEAEYPSQWAEVEAYLLDHPDALRPEPLPPPPTAAQLTSQEIATLRAYLASTDWYVTRFTETGVPIPESILAERAKARARIDELKETV